jgi:hypothetical protein
MRVTKAMSGRCAYFSTVNLIAVAAIEERWYSPGSTYFRVLLEAFRSKTESTGIWTQE